MKNFLDAVKSNDTLSVSEMKNIKGAGNCGFMPKSTGGNVGRVVCDLDESEYPNFADLNGTWCCNDCSKIGC